MPLVSYRNRFRLRLPAPVRVATKAAPLAPSAPVMWPPEWLAYLRDAWARLHKRALVSRGNDSVWLSNFGRQLPCGACREHWDQMLLASPPDWNAYFKWSVDRHNEVNRRLGKPEVSVAQALALWGPHKRVLSEA